MDAPDDMLTTDGPGADTVDVTSSSALHLPKWSTQTEMLDDGLIELIKEPTYDEGTESGRKLGPGDGVSLDDCGSNAWDVEEAGCEGVGKVKDDATDKLGPGRETDADNSTTCEAFL